MFVKSETHLCLQRVRLLGVSSQVAESQDQFGQRASQNGTRVKVSAENESPQWRLGGGLDLIKTSLSGSASVYGFGSVGSVGEHTCLGHGCLFLGFLLGGLVICSLCLVEKALNRLGQLEPQRGISGIPARMPE